MMKPVKHPMVLQQQFFNQRIEGNKYYGKRPNNKNDMEQEINEEWNTWLT